MERRVSPWGRAFVALQLVALTTSVFALTPSAALASAQAPALPQGDVDGDGVSDLDDDCPAVAGSGGINGCPIAGKVTVHGGDRQGMMAYRQDAPSSADPPPVPSSQTFEPGPGIPPVGEGSLELALDDGGDAEGLRTSRWDGTLVSALTSLTYWTYVESGRSAPYVILDLDLDGTPVTVEDQLFFEPSYQDGTHAGAPVNQGTLAVGRWQRWDATTGGWWALSDGTFGPPLQTLQRYALTHPGARLASRPSGGAFRIVAGFGSPTWDDFVGNTDGLAVGTEGGAVTLFDMEPEPDSDSDGVRDSADGCPATPGGTNGVDGCPDSDGDGVRDLDDACPGTHKGPNGVNGCPDSDGDGVRDSADGCPATPGGTNGLNGCPDSDGDGVRDLDDACPGTHKGPNGVNGCPDSDGDGVRDLDDSCPGTPKGANGINGCPDSDGDGVRDLDDSCPGTHKGPNGVNGCPDSDGDGVRDLDDSCPGTHKGPNGVNGCPDSDGDGVRDQDDACPQTPGASSGGAGCPGGGDGSTTVPDGDEDGIGDSEDDCPSTPAGANGIRGCPDSDADGLTDPEDDCPSTPAGANGIRGCPDSDADGVVDEDDNCPAAPNAAQGDLDGDGTGDLCDTPAIVPTRTRIGFDAARGTLFGRVIAADPPAAAGRTGSAGPCEAARRVVLKKVVRGPDEVVRRLATVSDGSWRVRGFGDRRGRFYAVATAKSDSGYSCPRSRSRTIEL
jgi:hypothetical protein